MSNYGGRGIRREGGLEGGSVRRRYGRKEGGRGWDWMLNDSGLILLVYVWLLHYYYTIIHYTIL